MVQAHGMQNQKAAVSHETGHLATIRIDDGPLLHVYVPPGASLEDGIILENEAERLAWIHGKTKAEQMIEGIVRCAASEARYTAQREVTKARG
jgi:hypothetical protein